MEKFDFDNCQATPEWLASLLEKNGFLTKDEVFTIEQNASKAFGTSAKFHSLKIKCTKNTLDSHPINILMKVMKSEFLEISKKEIDFYETILQSQIELPLIKYYGSEISEEKKQAVLLFEDLSPTHRQHGIYQWPLPPVQNQCKDAITTLAKVHAYWWDHSCFGESGFERQPEQDVRQFYQNLEKMYVHFVDFLKDRISEQRKKILDLIFEKLPELVLNRLSNSNGLTVVHGDAHFGNYLYPRDFDKHQIVIIDWQTWELGLGVKDLSKLIGLHMFPEFRQSMEHTLLKDYFEEIQKQGANYKWEDFQTDYQVFVMDNLLIPIYQHSLHIVPTVTWWLNLENGFSAFEDNNCMELL